MSCRQIRREGPQTQRSDWLAETFRNPVGAAAQCQREVVAQRTARVTPPGLADCHVGRIGLQHPWRRGFPAQHILPTLLYSRPGINRPGWSYHLAPSSGVSITLENFPNSLLPLCYCEKERRVCFSRAVLEGGQTQIQRAAFRMARSHHLDCTLQMRKQTRSMTLPRSHSKLTTELKCEPSVKASSHSASTAIPQSLTPVQSFLWSRPKLPRPLSGPTHLPHI